MCGEPARAGKEGKEARTRCEIGFDEKQDAGSQNGIEERRGVCEDGAGSP